MNWFALYRDGELIRIRQWFGVPEVRDFDVGELIDAKYEIVPIATIGTGDTLGSIPLYLN